MDPKHRNPGGNSMDLDEDEALGGTGTNQERLGEPERNQGTLVEKGLVKTWRNQEGLVETGWTSNASSKIDV